MICPNCGAPLPDTANMCYSCRLTFNHESQNNNHYIVPVQQTDDYKALYIAGMVLGILAGVTLLLSAFLPYISASAFGFSQSFTLHEASKYYTIEVIIFCIMLIIDSIFQHGISNIIVGVILLALSVYRYKQYLVFIDENEINGIAHLGIGYYLILVSAVLTIASGIMLVVYNKS